MEALLSLVGSNASLQGEALNPILMRALGMPNLYHFSELLDIPRVRAHVAAAACREAHLFALFCSGTLAEYRAAPARYGALEGALLEKLKLLSLASLTACERTVPYAALRAALELDRDAEVEALVIQAQYAGLVEVRALAPRGPGHCPVRPLHFFPPRPYRRPPFLATRTHTHTRAHSLPLPQAQLDQRAKCVHVRGSAGRDVLPSELPALAEALAALQASVQAAVAGAEAELAGAVGAVEAEAAHKRGYAARSRAAAAACEAREAGGAEAAGGSGSGKETMEDPAARQAKRGRAGEKAEGGGGGGGGGSGSAPQGGMEEHQ